jgi:DNA-binding FrmR family transcriptional regulator
MDRREMITFEFFVHDDRYSVPTLQLIAAVDEAAARTAADMLLQASSHHLGVEVCREGSHLLALGVCVERRRTDEEPPYALRAASGG